MMLGPDKKAIATRRPDGKIVTEVSDRAPSKGLANIPFLRGSVRLVSQMGVGITALMRSAEIQEEAEAKAELTEQKPEGTEAADRSLETEISDTTSRAVKTGLETEAIESTSPEPEPETAAVEAVSTEPELETGEVEATAKEAGSVITENRPITATSEAATKASQPKTQFFVTKSRPTKSASRLDNWLEKHPQIALWGTVALGLGFSIVLFILLPSLITDGLKALTGWQGNSVRQRDVLLAFVEGAIRIFIFLAYLWFTSRIKEVRRVWMYHGSEHKTIATYEAGEELTVENVRRHSRFHPRCGTSFMFLVMLVSILVFALVGRHGALLNVLLRLALLPLVAGISYELIKLAGRFDNPLTRFISLPGLALQRLTTAEPDDSMLEVAISAMKAVIPADPTRDNW